MSRKTDRHLGRRREAERGQVLALFAGGMIAFLVLAGLVLDGGIAFVNRRDAQNQADLGALAGTHVIAERNLAGTLAGGGAAVYAAVEDAVEANGCQSGGSAPCSWTAQYVRPTTGYDTAVVGTVSNGGAIPAQAQGVAVVIDREPESYLVRVIGQIDWDISANATAITARIDDPGPGILLPIAFDPGPDRDLAGIDLREGYFPDPPPVFVFSEGKDAPGNFSWLSWNDANDAVTLVNSICEPNNPAMAFPTYAPGGPGKMNKSQGRDCLDDYIGETVFVPFWGEGGSSCSEGPVTGNGANTDFCLLGVAAFELLGRDFGGDNQAVDGLYGRLQRFVTTTSIPENFSGPPCNPATDSSCGSFSSYLGLID